MHATIVQFCGNDKSIGVKFLHLSKLFLRRISLGKLTSNKRHIGCVTMIRVRIKIFDT